MPFLRLNPKKLTNSTAHSLRAYLDTCQGSQNILSFLFRKTGTELQSLKRASRLIAHRKTKASMTLEAAFALPFFLFAVVNILFLVNIIGTQSRFNAALHQTGNRMAFAAYAGAGAAGGTLSDAVSGVVISGAYAKDQIIKYVGRDYLHKSCVAGGEKGVLLAGTSVMERGDVIDLQIFYKVLPFSNLMGFDGFGMTQRYYGKAWTGYDVEQYVSDSHETDPMVYITETGTVYHLDRNCSHLNPSVEAVAAESIAERRNQSGGKYVSCERCGGSGIQETVYITTYGNSYHSNLTCSGLRRTIYTVPLSQAGGRGRCSRCG